MKLTGLKLFGLPVFGFWLPFIGRRSIPLNRDLTFVDTGKPDLFDEVGVFEVRPPVVEWFGVGIPVGSSHVFDVSTGKPVPVPAGTRITR